MWPGARVGLTPKDECFDLHRSVELSMSHWFEPIADHLGPAYLRYWFTKGTAQKIDFVIDALLLRLGDRVLDIGCGPGRHSYELARRGYIAHGIDIRKRFIDLAEADAPPGDTVQPRGPPR